MKFYLDENMSPKIAEIVRTLGTEAVSAHDVNMAGTADEEQLDFAAHQKRCLVIFNRNDFIELSRMYLDAGRAHLGL
jgi:predicted nuclease of predicted toxin-antitoxin system